jgi:hypothetical protein
MHMHVDVPWSAAPATPRVTMPTRPRSGPARLPGSRFPYRVADDAALRERPRAGARQLAADVLSWDRATAIVLAMLRRAVAARP